MSDVVFGPMFQFELFKILIFLSNFFIILYFFD